MPNALSNAIPADYLNQPETYEEQAQEPNKLDYDPNKLVNYVTEWRRKLETQRTTKRSVWDECWQLYRGLEDFSEKEDWQSQIVLPKAWSSVKQATSTIKRLLSTAKAPWTVEPVNPDDLVLAYRAGQMTDLIKVLLENANFMEEFSTGLECGFIIGLGVWKVWWGLEPRTRVRVQNIIMGPQGEQEVPPNMVDQLLQQGAQIQKRLIREDIMEGKLKLRAVDPYNFYWLPGSKLNQWVGTVEVMEIPKWELMELARQGVFDIKDVKDLQPKQIPENQRQSYLRFGERERPTTPSRETDTVTVTEYHGPIVIDDEMVERYGHVITANDDKPLLAQKCQLWSRKPPYVGYSPLNLPFRTEGIGLVEMVRQIDKALSRLTNMSVDTLLFRLLPIFEVNQEAYENPEDFETGLTPGKVLRRNQAYMGLPGLRPIEFADISQGAIQMSGALDRSHQEGALVSEIQQAIPRYRGVQTATEISEKSDYQDSFFGAMAADIELQAIKPIVEQAVDLALQFLFTSNDERVASVLGLGAPALQAMSREEIVEMIQGDYKIKVTGITGQLQKAEMLQNLVQLMNILGQNPEAWMPYVNQDALLRRILEAFRPSIHDIEDIVADPATVEARKAAQQQQTLTPDMIAMIPQLVQQKIDQDRQAQEQQAQAQQAAQEQQAKAEQLAMHQHEMDMEDKRRKEDMAHEVAMEAARADAEIEIARAEAKLKPQGELK